MKHSYDDEAAKLLFSLARGKGNWGGKGDRLEHFKRFPHLNEIVKDLSNKNWLIIKKKPNYILISLNTRFKKDILDFIKLNIQISNDYFK